MILHEIEQLFAEKNYSGIIDNITEDIKKVEYYSTIMKQNMTDNGEEVSKAMSELTGVFMSLKIVLAIATTEKKNAEVKYYVNLKTEVENSGKKFVSASADKEASQAVSEYRRIKNIVEGYVEACNKSISTLQSILKKITAEIPLNNK